MKGERFEGVLHHTDYHYALFHRQVTGHANEAQVLLSIQQYTDKPALLIHALNHLFQIFRFSVCNNQRAALQVCMFSTIAIV